MENISPTQELLFKHAHGYTKEIIDILFDQKIISEDQLVAGVFLRNLRRKIFGKNSVTACDYSRLEGRNIFYDSEDLSEEYELYKDIILNLKNIRALKIVVDICIYNLFPSDKIGYSKLSEGLSMIFEKITHKIYYSLDSASSFPFDSESEAGILKEENSFL